MRFTEFKTYLQSIPIASPIDPGPLLPEWPGRFVLLTPVSSPGHQTDGLTDTVGWQVRAAGEQDDFVSAESLAWQIDDAIMSLNNTTTVSGVRVISGFRTGSPPTPLQVDDAGRHHFVCSYLFVVRSAVAVR